MKHKITDTIDKYNMIKDGDSVCVALSGGPDSVSLFNYFVENRDILKINKLYACHLNHNLRGKESDRDENFVKMLCADSRVEVFIKSVDINALCGEIRTSVEETARNARYDFFREIHEKYDCKIATAHTLSDCMETAVFNMSRGTGTRGLCGITPVRDYIIRPLIRCSRREVEKYCCENDISFVTDSTNNEDVYTRNRIRHGIIPKLYELNPAVENAFVRLFEQGESEQAYLDLETDRAYESIKNSDKFMRKPFLELHKAIAYRLLAKALSEYDIEISFLRLELLYEYILSGTGTVQLNKNYYLNAKSDFFEISENEKSSQEYFEEEIKFQNNETEIKKIFPKSKTVIFQLIQCEQSIKFEKNLKKDLKNCLDYDKIKNGIFVRQKKEGDKITLSRRNCTKSLKKLFTEMKIPAEKRESQLIMSDGEDVIWVEGAGVSQKTEVNNETKNIIKIIISED